MKTEQIILCFINSIAAMGFSLIPPLFPPLCKDKEISNIVCSWIMAIICLPEIYVTLYYPQITEKYGKKRILLLSLIIGTISSVYYGIMSFLNNKNFFIITGFINRIFHGFCNGILNTTAFSLTSLINSGPELEFATGYMELSYMIGFALGPILDSIFYSIGGYFLPFCAAGLIYLIGFFLSFYIPQLNDDYKKNNLLQIKTKKLPKNLTSLLPLLKYPKNSLLIWGIMFQINARDFLTPTLVNYLKDSFNLSTSTSSLFFISSTLIYGIIVQFINNLTKIFSNFLLIVSGLFIGGIGCLLDGPISILPNTYKITIIGMSIQGIAQCFVNIPTFMELNNFNRSLFPNDEELIGDITSSFFNLSFYIGDLWSPILGSFLTSVFNFKVSSYFSAFLAFILVIIFIWYFNHEIYINQRDEIVNKKESNIINREEHV